MTGSEKLEQVGVAGGDGADAGPGEVAAPRVAHAGPSRLLVAVQGQELNLLQSVSLTSLEEPRRERG